MKIACLGWGSLIWDTRPFPVKKPWFSDGPLLPVEFARQSKGNRITLVIVPKELGKIDSVRTLWALMSVDNLEIAKQELAEREGKHKEDDIKKYVHCWIAADKSDSDIVKIIGEWATGKGLDAVVWTALLPKFNDEENKFASIDEVFTFLRSLNYVDGQRAEEYIRKTPRQIDTNHRRRIEMEFGWTPTGEV